MAVPRPGRAVRGSATGRPLMAALDLLGRRWALRILWELTDGPRGARELRQRCDAMSPSVLYQRLAAARAARQAQPPAAPAPPPAADGGGPPVTGEPAGDRALRSPARAQQRASTRAAGARRQAKRDSR